VEEAMSIPVIGVDFTFSSHPGSVVLVVVLGGTVVLFVDDVLVIGGSVTVLVVEVLGAAVVLVGRTVVVVPLLYTASTVVAFVMVKPMVFCPTGCATPAIFHW
jgi:hypothetical protein